MRDTAKNLIMKRIALGIALCALFPAMLMGQKVTITGSYAETVAKLGIPKVVGTSNMECIYEYKVFDPVLQDTEVSYDILEVGDSVYKYGNYGSYQLDSALAYRPNIIVRDYYDLSNKYRPKAECMVTNRLTDSLTYYGKVSIDNFSYEEPVPPINWTLTDSTKMVCGYECHQATCTFRGRTWTAWYCDLPLSIGPWKLHGLPGMILAAEDASKEQSFTAITIRKASRNITVADRDYFKTKRERYNKSLAAYKEDPGKVFRVGPLAPKTLDGKPMKVEKARMFYNPLEKE